SMSLRSNNEFTSFKLPKGQEQVIYETIEIYYNDNEQYITEPNKRYDFFVKYQDIAGDFNNIVQRWFEDVEESLRPITNILLDSLHYKKSFDETEFLFVFQGVEAFHRRCLQNTTILKEHHKAYLKEKLKSMADKEFKSWLLQRLNYAYEPFARVRLESIFKNYKDILIPGIEKKQYSLWIKQMVDSRNFLTHFDPDSADKKVDSTTLYHYTSLLKALLAILILKHIGLNDEILALIPKTYSYSLDKLINEIK
ncbi:MAG TPA: hypothetical protein DIT07_10365, partial [Sphingobacteriaceae bacterium]|nr:hypothetical protein [Sphingobacteriaceae bacterium]